MAALLKSASSATKLKISRTNSIPLAQVKMIRKPQIGRSRFYDVIHRGLVYTCMSVTCLAIFYTGIRFYEAYKFDQRTRVAGKLKHEDSVEALDSKINFQSG